jgi:ABC-type branched-subunit amino acid transport system substrate-binding protein
VAAAGLTLIVAGCGGGAASTARTDASVQGSDSSQSQAQPAPNTGTQANPAPAAPGAANPAPAAPGAANPGAAAPGNPAPGAGRSNLPPAPVGVPKPGAPVPNPGAAQAGNTDVGVTATQINIGIINIASANRSLGPPIALASQRIDNALFNQINAAGGVAGRKLNLLTCDDGGDVTRARACYEKLKGQVFAFIPSETFVTDVIHDTLAKDKVPWLSWGWFKSEYTDPYMFPCHANGMREATNLAKWVSQNRHPQTVGIMYLNVAEDIAAKDAASRTFQQYGVKVVQSVGQEWDSPDESQHVLAMRVANPDMVITFSWPAPVAKFLHDAGAQNWAPKMGFAGNHMTGDPGYGPIFSDFIKDKYLTITSWAVPGQGNPEGNLPGNQLWQQLTAATGKDLSGFHFKYAMGHHITQSAIACTRVLADVASSLGPNLTRARFIDALESRSFETGFGVTLRWPHGDHGAEPYSFNKEFLYEWVGSPDGGFDMKRVLPDPVNL